MDLRPSMWGALFGMGCIHPIPTEPPPDFPSGVPSFTDLVFECDAEAGRWRFEASASSWAGGGGVAWSEDGDYVEVHQVFRTVSRAEDGSDEVLRGDVGIITDFRQPANGATVFSCDARPRLMMWSYLLDLEGNVADCQPFGTRRNALRDLSCGEFPGMDTAQP